MKRERSRWRENIHVISEYIDVIIFVYRLPSNFSPKLGNGYLHDNNFRRLQIFIYLNRM